MNEEAVMINRAISFGNIDENGYVHWEDAKDTRASASLPVKGDEI